MNSNHRPTDIEARLDAAIDALNTGQPVSGNGDPELASLIATVQSARNSGEPEWPDASFPTRLARNLSAQLQAAPRQTTRRDKGQLALPPTPDEHWGPISSRPVDPAALTDDEPRPSRRRQVAGIVAAAAAFSLLTFLLVTVFDAWRSPSAVYYDSVGGNDPPRQIAFVKDVEGQAEIFIVSSNGDDLANLTDHAANDRAPTWSPDGQTLAFVSDRTGRDEIYLMDADGGNVRQLTDAGTPSRSPTWSPDGQFVAFIRMRDGIRDQPWIMNADGSDQRPLNSSEPLEEIIEPIAWSPDNTTIAYIFDDPSVGLGISSVVDDRSMVAPVDSVDTRFVDWSPDGKWITFNIQSGTNHIEAFNAEHLFSDMREFRSLTRDPSLDESQAQWSPTGDAIIFFGSSRTSSERTRGLYRMSPDGSSQQQLARREGNRPFVRARWSPDGKQIAFLAVDGSRMDPSTSNGLTGDVFELAVLDYATGDQRKLADDIWAGFDDPPAWRPLSSDAATPPPTEVPEPDQTAQSIFDATPVQPTPEGSAEPDEATIPALTPTQPATDDFAAQVQAALDALPDEMVGCNATPGTPKQLNPGAQTGTEYRGLALVGKEPLLAMAWGEEDDTIQEGIGSTRRAIIGWYIGSESTNVFELEVRELGDGTTLEPEYGGILEPNDWMEGPVHFTTMRFPTSGCWQVVATNGDRAGVVWIDVPEEPLETAAPTLTLDPAIGTCETTPTLRGAGFEPGTQVTVFVGRARGDNPATLSNHPNVAVDGTFEAQLDPRPAITAACQSGQIPPGGLEYAVSVSTGTGPKSDEDNWRAPMGSATYTLVADESSASQEALDEAIVESAIETVRTFLDEPDAELTVDVVTTPAGERQALLTREVDAAPYPDEFAVDAQTGKLLRANIWSHTTSAASLDPIGAEEAIAVAENATRRTSPGFDQLTFVGVVEGGTVQGANGQEPVLTASWQLQTDSGVWLPTEVRVEVDLETGLIVGYFDMHYPYRGTLEPQITEEEALNIALSEIAADPEIAGSSIREVRLEVTSIVAETAPTASDPRGTIFEVTATEQHLVWTAYLDDDGRPGGRRHIWVDAISGEILNPMGSANG